MPTIGGNNDATHAEPLASRSKNAYKNSPLQSKTWLSKGIETLYARQHSNQNTQTDIFDVVIIGSGYGGAIAAQQLSQFKDSELKVAVLERGREFIAGAFPNNASEAPTELRTSPSKGGKPKGNLEGLYDVRLGADLNVILGNGLGGGSLINAGVMARANHAVFNNPKWPSEITSDSLLPYYEKAEELLGSVNIIDKKRQQNTIFSHPSFSNKGKNKGPDKYESLKRLSQGSKNSEDVSSAFTSASITINMVDKQLSSSGVELNACNLCGDCVSGCNNNAKISLDKNLLAQAANNGVEIFTGVTVNSLEKAPDSLWTINTVYTDAALRSRHSQEQHLIKARKVIVAAGAMGSTEILLRSQKTELCFSKELGKQFSSNGDMMVVGYAQNKSANAVADPTQKHSERGVGPTITGMIDLRKNGASEHSMVIQEMAVPSALKHFFSELYSTTASIRDIWTRDSSKHLAGSSFADPAAVSPDTINSTSLYAVMGDDGASGELGFTHDDSLFNEGTLQVQWPSLKQHSLFNEQFKKISSLAGTQKNKNIDKGLGGMVIPNPFWQLLKPMSMKLLNLKQGAPLTVHPLGGCPMGSSIETGVCNHHGRVYDAENGGFHDGLLVLDGAIIPEAVGINPALTISAVCLKAMHELIEKEYFTGHKAESKILEKNKFTPPTLRSLEQLETAASNPIKDTEITITERLVGVTKLRNNDGILADVVIELTLWSKALALNNFSEHQAQHRGDKTQLIFDTSLKDDNKQSLSKIRLYNLVDWQALRSGKIAVDANETVLDDAAQFIASIEGQLAVLGRAKSSQMSRTISSIYAWLLNRGIRDVHQSRKPLEWEQSRTKKSLWQSTKLFYNYVSGMLNSFTRAGEIRTLKYKLSVNEVYKSNDYDYFYNRSKTIDSPEEGAIIGTKYISYSRRSNPWLQLSKVHLEKLPQPLPESNLDITSLASLSRLFTQTSDHFAKRREAMLLKKHGNTLSLDLNYLAKVDTPLIQISQQENQVQALMELSSFAAYITRMLVGVHFYSFRAPEIPAPREANRMASETKGLPKPNTIYLPVGTIPDNSIESLKQGDIVNIALTHYKNSRPNKPPILMIHGYSASSTTFAHASLDNSLARHFYEEGRDVWLLDLRTSCAFNSSRYPWSFECVAEFDIPIAIEHIIGTYKSKQKIDILSHCMGSAMLSMSILKFADTRGRESDFFQQHINKIVFSQATPAVKFTQDNNFRSFATQYFKEFVPDNYQFQSEEGQASTVLDRVLYTLPYPTKEFDILNSPFTPSKRANFARTRHRMDAFFTRTFELNNVSAKTLNCLDDFFGPIHVNTIIQASQFATNNVLTDAKGRNQYISRVRLHKYWGQIPTMSFHSKNNGLIDYSTGERSQRIFQEAGVPYTTFMIEDPAYGHQDSLISPNAHIDVFPRISDFLNSEASTLDVNHSDIASDHNPSNSNHSNHIIIESPSQGPLIIEATSQGDTLSFNNNNIRISFGTNVARAAEPLAVFLPVKIKNQQLSLATEESQSAQSFVSEHIELAKSYKANLSPWWKIIDIPKSLFKQSNTVALLLIYDDLEHLCPSDKPKLINNSIFHRENCCTNEEITQVLLKLFEPNSNDSRAFLKSVIRWQNTSSESLCFALGSCQYPSGILDKKPAYSSYQQLKQRLDENSNKSLPKPQFLTLVGDQIYADATAGLLDPSTQFDQYSLPYLRLYQQPPVRDVLRQLPSFNMLDDHELVDNWEPLMRQSERSTELESAYSSGVRSFLKYQRGQELANDRNVENESLWYHFRKQEHDFFMCDTRTERQARTAENIDTPSTTIMQRPQANALQTWLANTKQDKTRFILSGSLLLPRHHCLHGNDASNASSIRSDSWDGYPCSLHSLLAFLVDTQQTNTVFLSGDDHIACFAEIEISNQDTQKSLNTWSAHCPGLYTPFPFANGRVDDFEGELISNSGAIMKKSEFKFKHNNTSYICRVNARFGQSNYQKIQLGPINIEAIGGFLLISAS